MTPVAIKENSNENGILFEDLDKPNAKAKKTRKLKIRRGFSYRENLLSKALSKERQVSQSWRDELELTNLSLNKANEKLKNYKLANKGQFEMAVNVETSRRLKDICVPLGKAMQLNINNVVCMLKSLTDMKTLVASLSKHGHSIKSASIEEYNTAPKVAVVHRRRNVVHPMVKGHVLQPATINIPRVSMRGLQSCILNKTAAKRKKHATIPCTPINSGTSEGIVTESGESSDAVELTLSNQRAKRRRKTTTELTSGDDAQTSGVVERTDRESNPPSPLREEDPLEGPSWLYNGRIRKNEQNRKEIMERIKKGNKAPMEYLVYIDNSSSSETDDKRVSEKKPYRKRRKYATKSNTSRLKPTNDCEVTRIEISKTRQLSSNRELIAVDGVKGVQKLPVSRGCSVVLIRPHDDFGRTKFPSDDTDAPLDKENIPPIRQPTVVVNGNEIKLRGFTVVIEDIMKKDRVDVSKDNVMATKSPKLSIGRVHHMNKVRADSKIRKINCRSKMLKSELANKPNKLFAKTSKRKLTAEAKPCREIPFVTVVKREYDMGINIEQIPNYDTLDVDPLAI